MSKTENNITPVYAAVGAADLAYQQVNEVIAQLRERTEAATEQAQARFEAATEQAQARYEETREQAQARIEAARERLQALPEEFPSDIEGLREKFTAEELRKVAEAYIEVATDIYNSLAERGEDAVGRLRAQPLVDENISRVEKAYADAQQLTEEALGTVSSRTRAVGERAAKLVGKDEEKAATKKTAAKKAPAKKATATKAAPAKKAPAKKAPAKKTAAKKAPAKKAAK
jgi:heparin binding hemagglutinin HbhA